MHLLSKTDKLVSVDTSVHYQVLNKAGKAVVNVPTAICFRDITYGACPADACKIELWWPQKNTPYSETEIERWVSVLRQYGFLVYFDGKKDTNYCFSIPLYNEKEELLFNRYILNSTLILTRLLFEAKLNHIPGNFFKLQALLPGEDNFYLLQFAHHFQHPNEPYPGNWNHAVRNVNIFHRFLTLDDLSAYRKKPSSIFAVQVVSIGDMWGAGFAVRTQASTIEDAYFEVKAASGL